MNKDKIRKIEQVTSNRRLNFYELEAVDRAGKTFPYYVSSRAETVDDLVINRPDKAPDGVVIYCTYGQQHERVVLIRQYRYPLGGYVYEFPAGLVENGEDYHKAAVREMKEETGLTIHPLRARAGFEHAFPTSAGMTDERCSMVFARAEGIPDTGGLEMSEELEVVLATREEAARILREENTALICAYMLMHFISCEGDPLAFAIEKEDGN